MRIMIGHSLKRLTREGAKSLSVPLVAMVFVLLINLLGGIRSWLETQYEDTMDNFPVIAVLSDLSGENTNELEIEKRIIDLFVDPDVNFSLSEHTRDIVLKRSLEGTEIPGGAAEVNMVGISTFRENDIYDPEYSAEITFFEGYDDSIFLTDELVCVVSDDLLPLTQNNVLSLRTLLQMPDRWEWSVDPDLNPQITVTYGERGRVLLDLEVEGIGNFSTELLPIRDENVVSEMHRVDGNIYFHHYINVTFASTLVWRVLLTGDIVEGEIVPNDFDLTVIGTVSGVESNTVFSPFWTVNAIDEELTENPPFSESLSVRVSNNRELDEFKEIAEMSFPRTNPIFDSRPFAMTIMDLEFYETLEPLRQNIIVVDVATPFIYFLSIAVGFLTSVLLTRRRRAEFAIMRSIGVSKWVVFMSALAEQSLLSVAGAALGFAFVAAAWGYTSLTRPAIFLACYLLGAVFASIGAAGTNVMKVLRDRRE